MGRSSVFFARSICCIPANYLAVRLTSCGLAQLPGQHLWLLSSLKLVLFPFLSGKSTLIGVLSSSGLDDGRGAARSLVLRHRHEQENGRTSAVTMEIMGYAKDGKQVRSPFGALSLALSSCLSLSLSLSLYGLAMPMSPAVSTSTSWGNVTSNVVVAICRGYNKRAILIAFSHRSIDWLPSVVAVPHGPSFFWGSLSAQSVYPPTEPTKQQQLV